MFRIARKPASFVSSAGFVLVRCIFVCVLPFVVLPGLVFAADPSPAQRLFQLVNNDRAQLGLPALAWDDRLAAAAQKHTQLMADNNQAVHQLSGEAPLGRRLAGVPWDVSGENIALNTSITRAHNWLMKSPPHRANILNREFNRVGIGVAWKGNQVYVTEDFAHRIR